jgi:hypothetical protein
MQGLGLLLLRVGVAGTLLSESPGRSLPILVAALVVAFGLTIGLLTIIAAFLATLIQATDAFAASTAASGLFFASLAQSLALAFLGPGAYSLDARLYGRRLIFESRQQRDLN